MQVQQEKHRICFDQPVLLICQYPSITSGVFSSTRPSWKEDGAVFALDGGMYRSATRINETQTILELVPKQSHFEPSGAHNYTCFLPLVGGGVIESNPVQISPISKLTCILRLPDCNVTPLLHHCITRTIHLVHKSPVCVLVSYNTAI